MPKKKKGGKKKSKKVKKSTQDDEPTTDNADPSTLIGGDVKKKKKKKPKLTKAQRAEAKLEKAINAFKLDRDNYLHFIDKMDAWLQKNYTPACELFNDIDPLDLLSAKLIDTHDDDPDMDEPIGQELSEASDEENDTTKVVDTENFKLQDDKEETKTMISFDKFKAGMYDLDIPCNKVQLHLLAKFLDKDGTEEIDYRDLKYGLRFVREQEDASDDDDDDDDGSDEPSSALIKDDDDKEDEWEEPEETIKLRITERKFPKCLRCGLSVCEPFKEKKPKYCEVELRLITFDKTNSHPGHLSNLLVHSNINMEGLIGLIKEHTETASNTITLFRSNVDKPTSKEDMLQVLPKKTTLEKQGFLGGTYTSPEPVRLYYDYLPEFIDCPLLLYDEYFLGKK